MKNFLDKIIPDNIDEEMGYFLLLWWVTFHIYLVWGFFDSRMFEVYASGMASSATLLMFACVTKDVVKNDDFDDKDWIFYILVFLMSIVLIVFFTIEVVLK